jgi:hypothetical protein
MIVDKKIRDFLLEIHRTKRVSLEGNLLKIIEAEPNDVEFSQYLTDSLTKDKETRRARLDINKSVQLQNANLLKSKEENEKLMVELKESLEEVEESKMEALRAKDEALKAKELAEGDLDIMQKRSQFELIGTIVKVALFVILGVGVITTLMYCVSLAYNKDTQIIGSTWSNMFGILLTNAFSIVGTIMGVKYASENKK